MFTLVILLLLVNTREFILFLSILQIIIKCPVDDRLDLRYWGYGLDQNNISALKELPFWWGKQKINK